MRPSVGRIVHYVMLNGIHRPAIISGVTPDTPIASAVVHLHVMPVRSEDFPIAGAFDVENVRRDETGHERGTWHEPERV